MARSRILIPLLVLAGVLVVYGTNPTALRNLRHQAFDQLQRLHPRPWVDAGVRVVDLDDETLARVGQWPWPRSVVATLVDRLREAGAAAIAFDIVFAEPDRTAPSRVAELWPELAGRPDLNEALRTLPDPDARLARSIAGAPVVVGYFLVSRGSNAFPPLRAQVLVGSDAGSRRDPLRRVPRFPAAVHNLPELEAVARGHGAANGLADPDGVHRRVPLLYRMGDRVLPSLALEALRVAIGGDRIVVRAADSDRELGLASVALPPRFTLPTDPSGAIWLRYARDGERRVVPAWRVLAGEVGPRELAGTLVFVGTSAAGLRDQRPTPLDPYLPGVMLHAELAEHAILGLSLKRPGFMVGAEWLCTASFGLLVVVLVRFASALVGAVLTLGVAAAAVGASIWAFAEHQWLLDPVSPGLGVVAVFLVSSVLAHLSEESQKRRVRSAFGHYLAPALVSELSADPSRLRLGGEMRELSFLFCDVRGFTSLSERMEPEELTLLVNRLLTPLSGVILERRGTIDKYMGDCIMAFWNAPLAVSEHARLACEAALAMLRELELLNARLEEEARRTRRHIEPLRLGVGINTGRACVGNLGSEQRFDYSVIGDAVNLASRLEGQSKTYGVDVVIGDATRQAAPGFATLELDWIRVRGKREPTRIHALLGGAERARRLDFLDLERHHRALLKAYRAQEWDRALAELEECVLRAAELEGLYALYRERIEGYRMRPPPPGWDGVFTASTK